MSWRFLAGVVLAVLLASPTMPARAAAADPPTWDRHSTAPISAPAKAFDTLFWEIDDGIHPLATKTEIDATMGRLRAAIPRGDVHRDLQYRYMYCLVAFDEDTAGAIAYARAGVAYAMTARDRASEGALRSCLARSLNHSGESDAALHEYERAAHLGREAGDRNVEGLALAQGGLIKVQRGDLALGLRDLLAAQAAFEAGRVEFMAEFNLNQIATAYSAMGDHDKAIEHFDRMVAFAEGRNDSLVQLRALSRRADAHQGLGNVAQAERDLLKALELARKNHRADVAGALLDLAGLYNDTGRHHDARSLIAQAQATSVAMKDEPYVDYELGRVRAGLGSHASALPLFDAFLASARRRGIPGMLMQAHRARAGSLEALGRPQQALQELRAYADQDIERSEKLRDQRVMHLRFGFEAQRRDLQNRDLALAKARAERLAAAVRRGAPWRTAALGFGIALVLALGGLSIRQLRRMRSLGRDASTDALTGACNRRAITQAGAATLVRERDAAVPPCVLILDLDHFKRINDRYGHAAGDAVLKRAVAAWQRELRASDLLGRLGGEEFLVILRDAPMEAAQSVAERLVEATREIDLSDIAADLKVTTSVGLAQVTPRDDALSQVVERADAALYRAKAGGRDRVEAAAPAA